MRIAVFPKGQLDALVVDRTLTVFDLITMARGSANSKGLSSCIRGAFDDISDSFVDRVGDALQAAGFEMPMLCASPDFTHPDADVRAAEFDRQAELIRIAPGSVARAPVPGAERAGAPGGRREQGVAWAAEAITALLPLARELESRWRWRTTTRTASGAIRSSPSAPSLPRIVDRIEDRVHFGVQYDPSNAIVAGVDSADFLDSDRPRCDHAGLRPLARRRHLAGRRCASADGTLGYSPMLQHGVIGRGSQRLPADLPFLVAAGYDGWISIEDGVNGFDEMRQSVEFLRRGARPTSADRPRCGYVPTTRHGRQPGPASPARQDRSPPAPRGERG